MQDERPGVLNPGERALAWSACFLTGYGLVVIAATLIADKNLVPSDMPAAGGLIAALLLAGGAWGALLARVRH